MVKATVFPQRVKCTPAGRVERPYPKLHVPLDRVRNRKRLPVIGSADERDTLAQL